MKNFPDRKRNGIPCVIIFIWENRKAGIDICPFGKAAVPSMCLMLNLMGNGLFISRFYFEKKIKGFSEMVQNVMHKTVILVLHKKNYKLKLIWINCSPHAVANFSKAK